MKYRLTDETKVVSGHTLHRIEALKDFADVHKGDKGGFVEGEHSSNKWVKAKDEFDYNRISNRVYKMSYRIYERSSYRTGAKKYDVMWDIYTNWPQLQTSYKIAGQKRVCSTREEAEKYIQGRIKAYSHLFTEISPPIPKKYEKFFKVHGQLLPGYIVEEA